MITKIIWNQIPESLGDVDPEAFTEAMENDMSRTKSTAKWVKAATDAELALQARGYAKALESEYNAMIRSSYRTCHEIICNEIKHREAAKKAIVVALHG